MALYAIGDLHLAFSATVKAPMQLESKVWVGHEKRLAQNCAKLIRPEDTLVLVGDSSWGRKLPECVKDLEYIEHLPGRKILVRGNHDMFWEAGKTSRLNELYAGRLLFLQDNFYTYEDYALVGTKGISFEGPFYLDRAGRIIGWDAKAEAQAEKLKQREMKRLRISFEKAVQGGYRKFIMFLHYPPTSILEKDSCFTKIAEEYGVEQVVYAHSHGEANFSNSIQGKKRGIRYSLVSGDYLRWQPRRIL